jgi:hypothetical protein
MSNDFVRDLVEYGKKNGGLGRAILDGTKVSDLSREELLAVVDYLVERDLFRTGKRVQGVVHVD